MPMNRLAVGERASSAQHPRSQPQTEQLQAWHSQSWPSLFLPKAWPWLPHLWPWLLHRGQVQRQVLLQHQLHGTGWCKELRQWGSWQLLLLAVRVQRTT